MIDAIKKLFQRDRSIEMRMLEIITQQQDFIAKNINERIVYVDPESGYTNVTRFDEKEEKSEKEEDEFIIQEDMSPEDLQAQMEGNQESNSEEGEK